MRNWKFGRGYTNDGLGDGRWAWVMWPVLLNLEGEKAKEERKGRTKHQPDQLDPSWTMDHAAWRVAR